MNVVNKLFLFCLAAKISSYSKLTGFVDLFSLCFIVSVRDYVYTVLAYNSEIQVSMNSLKIGSFSPIGKHQQPKADLSLCGKSLHI